eukprot:TRINITY_DN2241_c0_g1_i2.p1 TRINITY_DN2241_c0_g1~~TRINITY_DN2241_c0_g1_i2.p1  ORF type:complete len:297 (-),score=88.69 TRINITY_DN2241_c0_g1_i2:197-1087(-)
MDKVKDKDLYELLGVEPDADEKTIRKAYRKKALTCHPDKNQDNKEAVKLFHELSDALEVLTDSSTRKAYDDVLKARKAAELRNRQLDGKRRKLKEDLEEREKASKFQEEFDKKTQEEKLAREIERLRKEGSKQLEKEQELVRQQLIKEASNPRPSAASNDAGPQKAKLKVKWSTSKESPYNRESLERIFAKYGKVTAVVVNEKKGGSALIEFQDASEAKMAANIEIGFFDSPLKVKLLGEEKDEKATGSSSEPARPANQYSGLVNDNDFESLVLRKLRQEEERKKLIAQMMAEEGD